MLPVDSLPGSKSRCMGCGTTSSWQLSTFAVVFVSAGTCLCCSASTAAAPLLLDVDSSLLGAHNLICLQQTCSATNFVGTGYQLLSSGPLHCAHPQPCCRAPDSPNPSKRALSWPRPSPATSFIPIPNAWPVVMTCLCKNPMPGTPAATGITKNFLKNFTLRYTKIELGPCGVQDPASRPVCLQGQPKVWAVHCIPTKCMQHVADGSNNSPT